MGRESSATPDFPVSQPVLAGIRNTRAGCLVALAAGPGKNKGLLTKDPTPFTLNGKDEAADNPLIKASDINNDDYLKLGARYATVGLSPPPEEQVVAIVLKSAEVADPEKRSLDQMGNIFNHDRSNWM